MTVELPEQIRRDLKNSEMLALTVVVRTRDDATWAPAGTELSAHQRRPPAMPAGTAPPAGVLNANGDLMHLLLLRAPKLYLWRALTDNDGSGRSTTGSPAPAS